MIKLADNISAMVEAGGDLADQAAVDVGNIAGKVVSHRPILGAKNYSLRRSFLGPTLHNSSRAKEYADSALLQAGWAIPGLAIGAPFGPAGMIAGVSAGMGVGKAHALAKEFARYAKAKDVLTPAENKAADRLLNGMLYGGITGALAGGAGGYALAGELGIASPIAATLTGMGWGGLLGGLLGRTVARETGKSKPGMGKILRKYE